MMEFNKKDVQCISPSKSFESKNFFSVKNLFSTRVITSKGEDIGKVVDVVFSEGKIEAIAIKSSGDEKVLIDMKFIELTGSDAVILNIHPITSLIGKKVYDYEGHYLGKVIGFDRDDCKNNYKSLIVKKNLYSKALVIKKEQVEVASENVILKEEK